MSEETPRTKNLRHEILIGISEAYTHALRSGLTMENICARTGLQRQRAIDIITNASEIDDLDDVSDFLFACGAEMDLTFRRINEDETP